MGMKTTLYVMFIIASVAQVTYAADSVQKEEADFCKVSYTDKDDGDAGTYLGECIEEMPNGKGEVSYLNGDRLQGEFKNGVVDGAATYRSAGGNIYEGGFHEGKRHGKGVYTWAQGSTYNGEWNVEDSLIILIEFSNFRSGLRESVHGMMTDEKFDRLMEE